MAQSMLRFVGPDPAPVAAEQLPQPTAPVAPTLPSRTSEFRLVDMTEGKAAPLPQFSVSARDVKATSQSTLKFGTTVPAATQVSVSAAANAISYDLRFRPSLPATQTSSAPARVAAPVAPPVAVIETAPAAPVLSQKIGTEQQIAVEEKATELFASPHIAANPYQPRIAMVAEHVPAPAPQHFDAQPVRAAREAAPDFIAPVGTELFAASQPGVASAAPTVTSSAPKKWDLPAMDYGAALRQVQPELPPIAKAKPIEPQRVVVRELPASAAGMFGVGAAEPLVAQAKQSPVVLTPSAPQIASGAPRIAASQSLASAKQQLEGQQPHFAVAPRDTAVEKPAAQPKVAVVAQSVTVSVAPAPIAAVPVVTNVQPPRVAATAPKLPHAAELDFSSVPIAEEPAKPQFVPAAAAHVASAVSRPAPAVQRELVPASIAAPSESKMPFAYQAGPLHDQPHVAEYKPAPVAPAAVQMPDPSQVVATADPQDPNTYTLSFAANGGQPPAMYVHQMQPADVGGEVGPEAVPHALPAPGNCNCGPYGQCGCPYLPGQSGTRALCGIDCGRCGSSCCSSWSDATCIPWALLGPGEYVGPARPPHVDTYYLRVNDLLTLTFIQSRKKSAEHYRIGVGDTLQIEWLQGASSTEKALDRDLLVQPDGTVTLPLIGDVSAAGKTVNDFRDEVVKLYSKYQRDPQITVTPLTVNVAVQDVLRAVTSKNASSGQMQDVRVTPEGTIQAAGIGSVYVQGLTLDELRSELEARYAQAYGPGLAVSPQLMERATSYVFMGGEVRTPGRYVLEGPTTVMQAIAQAGGWNIGGNLHQVVIFRRDENWCLKATKIDIRAPLYGKDPCPTNDVWLRDNDLVVVPKSCILCATDMINLYFTRGIYAVFPITYVYDFSRNSGVVPVP